MVWQYSPYRYSIAANAMTSYGVPLADEIENYKRAEYFADRTNKPFHFQTAQDRLVDLVGEIAHVVHSLRAEPRPKYSMFFGYALGEGDWQRRQETADWLDALYGRLARGEATEKDSETLDWIMIAGPGTDPQELKRKMAVLGRDDLVAALEPLEGPEFDRAFVAAKQALWWHFGRV